MRVLIDRLINENSPLMEFLRYGIVGGISTVTDFIILYLCQEFIFVNVKYSLYIGTALGFTAGLAVNYVMSLAFVFKSAKGTRVGRSSGDILLFLIIGATGLFLSELGMHIGAAVLSYNYIIVKVVVTVIVLFWNYLARKLLIFDRKRRV